MMKAGERPSALTIEDVAPFFISDKLEVKLESPFRLHRLQYKGDRYYYEMCEDEQGQPFPVWYLSVTTFTKRFMHSTSNAFLNTWKEMMAEQIGRDETKKYVGLTADYGTICHIILANIIKNQYYDDTETPDVVADYMIDNKIDFAHFPWWVDDIGNDALSFMQFLHEKEVKVVAVEFPIIWKGKGVGGTIDLVAWVKFGKKWVLAIIDFKSGRNGFWESHEAQLHLYKEAWNSNFSEMGLAVTHVFNWAPKNWRDKPTYHWKNQTDSPQAELMPGYLKAFELLGGNTKMDRTRLQITQPINVGESTEGKFTLKTYDQIAVENYIRKHIDE